MPGLSSPRLPARRRAGGGCPVPAGNRSFPACSSGLACPCVLSALSSLFAAVSTRPRGATALRPRGPPTVGFGVRRSAWSRPVLCVSAWRRCVCRLASSPARGRPQPETGRRGAARWGAAPRGPRPRGPRPAGPTPRWAAGAVGLGHGDGLGLGDGASAVSRAWGGAEEGGEQGRRRAGTPHVHGRVPVACIPPTSCFWSPVPAYTAPAPRSPGPRGRGLEAAPCLPAPGQWVHLSAYPPPPPPAAEASILVPRLWAPCPLPCGVSAASLRSRRPGPGQGGLPSGSGVLRGLGEPRGPPHPSWQGPAGATPVSQTRPVAQQDFSPDTERL